MHHSSTEHRGASPHGAQRRTRPAAPSPPEGARLWAGMVLWALVAPGACGLTADMEDTIVELHNYYRGQVFPTATAMMPLKWDPSLQVLAGGHVSQCTWQHNPLLSDTGENLFVTEGALDIQVALEQWFMEHLNYNYDNNSCPEDKMCGHYTQMVWADSHRVGCELHSCDVMQGLEIGPSQFLVCNYYPAGNYDDQKPYEEGDWCSRCPEDLQKCENHLCVPDVEEEEEDDEDDEDMTLSSYTTEPPIASFPFGSTEAPPPMPSEDTPIMPSEDTPPTPLEDTPSTPSEDTPPVTDSVNVELPAHLAEEETVEEVLKEEPKEEKQKEEEPKEEEQKEAEQKDEEQKEEPKQTKLLIETRWEQTREAPASSRATSCSAYDNFLLLCLVGALVLRL